MYDKNKHFEPLEDIFTDNLSLLKKQLGDLMAPIAPQGGRGAVLLLFHVLPPGKQLFISSHPLSGIPDISDSNCKIIEKELAKPRLAGESIFVEGISSIFSSDFNHSCKTREGDQPLKSHLFERGYTILPLSFIGAPVGAMIIADTKKNEDYIKLCQEVLPPAELIIGHYKMLQLQQICSGLQTDFADSGKNLVDQFMVEVAKVVLPSSIIKANSLEWEKFCEYFEDSEEVVSVHLVNNHSLSLRMPISCFQGKAIAFSGSTNIEKQVAWAYAMIKNVFNVVYGYWEIQRQQNRGADAHSEALLQELQAYHQTLKVQEKQIGDFLATIKKTVAGRPPSASYEFYKGSTGWHIRFAGKMVSTGRNDKGLQYIHKLLQNPGRVFYPNQLELTKRNADAYLINVSENIGVTMHPGLADIGAGDEQRLREALKRFQQNEPDENDDIKTRIYYWSQLVYISHLLMNIRSSRGYIELYNDAKNRLDDEVFKFKEENDDELYVERILNQARVITRVPENDKYKRQLRQRVVNNMKNAIKNMDSEEIQSYFRETLTLQTRSCFNPRPVDPVNWVLSIDE